MTAITDMRPPQAGPGALALRPTDLHLLVLGQARWAAILADVAVITSNPYRDAGR
jgi:hypothetical protein